MNTTMTTYKNEAIIEQRKKLVLAIADRDDRSSEIARKLCAKIEAYPYECIDNGYIYDTIWASDLKSAIKAARDDLDGNTGYDAEDGTLWLEYYVRAVVPDEYGDFEHDSFEIELHPDEPACAEGHEHDWRSPYSVLGGLEENPGVWGNGGGAIIKQVCAHCGAYMITDTWAQNPSTGEQGLTSVSYEDADEDSQAWVMRRKLAKLRPAIEEILEGYDEITEYEIVKDGKEVLYRLEDWMGDIDDADYSDKVEAYLSERMPSGVVVRYDREYIQDESSPRGHRQIIKGLSIELDV